eukprot:6462973-Amphidinium_carterae.3
MSTMSSLRLPSTSGSKARAKDNGTKQKVKAKNKGGKKGDNYHNPKGAGKDKGQQPVVCYICGRPGHTSRPCYHNTK